MAGGVVRCFIDESRNVTQYSKRENVKTLLLALYCGPQRHVDASTCLACRVGFVVMPRIAWVRRQRAGANHGGPPLLDLWLLCWSMAGGVSRGT